MFLQEQAAKLHQEIDHATNAIFHRNPSATAATSSTAAAAMAQPLPPANSVEESSKLLQLLLQRQATVDKTLAEAELLGAAAATAATPTEPQQAWTGSPSL